MTTGVVCRNRSATRSCNAESKPTKPPRVQGWGSLSSATLLTYTAGRCRLKTRPAGGCERAWCCRGQAPENGKGKAAEAEAATLFRFSSSIRVTVAFRGAALEAGSWKLLLHLFRKCI